MKKELTIVKEIELHDIDGSFLATDVEYESNKKWEIYISGTWTFVPENEEALEELKQKYKLTYDETYETYSAEIEICVDIVEQEQGWESTLHQLSHSELIDLPWHKYVFV
ncbi:hypothetical protein HZI73_26315 (plasmid) [Vallitalea pronyensis]|uniref:Uncharacterized protein n=1 Tax=Vallitalea pronyensis TaxID=1348613 RepID=A0A8J8SJG1_9FIRM|nr:hypothetical protein [Vallitalea pronyensis]QUI25930.1 hypothetical protein HZI73_26315 [Vallitalea pronyensis]